MACWAHLACWALGHHRLSTWVAGCHWPGELLHVYMIAKNLG